MLELTIESGEVFDENSNEFISVPGKTIRLEHSLVSISKWESKWKKPFLTKDSKTDEETLDYIRAMTITQNVDPIIYRFLTNEHMRMVSEYVEDSMTATWFVENNQPSPPNKETITSELIYYWMIANQIPMECQKWHINRLLTLIRVCSIKNQPSKKMDAASLARNNAALNAARRKAMHTRG